MSIKGSRTEPILNYVALKKCLELNDFCFDLKLLLRKSYVALDLGGGSTQITFSPKYDETFQDTPSDFLHQVSVIRLEIIVQLYYYK